MTEGGKVGRFIFGSRDLRKDNRPRPSAFEPEKHPLLQRYETSVCGVSEVSFERICELGRGIRKDKKAIAVTTVAVAGVRQAGLTCEAAPEPQNNYPEHCVIIGWNEDDEKSARMSVQQVLALQAEDAVRFETTA